VLLNINPLLTGDLLKILDDMGHSDTILLADANYPAHRMGIPVVEIPGVDVVTMTKAVCEVMPLDEDHPPVLMDSRETPRPAVQNELIAATGARDAELVDRWKYYDLAKEAVAVISTGEKRTFANVILSKGLCHNE